MVQDMAWIVLGLLVSLLFGIIGVRRFLTHLSDSNYDSDEMD